MSNGLLAAKWGNLPTANEFLSQIHVLTKIVAIKNRIKNKKKNQQKTETIIATTICAYKNSKSELSHLKAQHKQTNAKNVDCA